jgi:excinuclease ABC subunit C
VALRHHRARRGKAAVGGSVLDSLPGVGPARRAAILRHFGSPERVLAASRDELSSVPGLPAKVARDIYDRLHKTAAPRGDGAESSEAAWN